MLRFNCLPFHFFTTFSWSHFWFHFKQNNILKCTDLLGKNFVPICPFHPLRYYWHLRLTTQEVIRKIAWRLVINENKAFTPPPWGYLSSDKWPDKNFSTLLLMANLTSNIIFDKTWNQYKLQLRLKRNHVKLCHFTNLVKVANNKIPIPSDKNMGWFWINDKQLQNIKQREILNYQRAIVNVNLTWENCIHAALSLFEKHRIPEAHEYINRWFKKHPTTKNREAIPKLYFLIKVGKLIDKGTFISDETKDLSDLTEPLPYRPILPFSSCPLFPLCEIVASVFNSLLKLFPWILIDTHQFVTWWHSTKGQGAPITTDATNLYGTIPPQEAINTMSLLIQLPFVNTYLNREFRSFMGVEQGKPLLIKLLELCLSFTFLQIDSVTYIQDKGLPMGNPAVPPVANLFLAFFEINTINTNLFRRYLDDICARYNFNMDIYPAFIKLNVDHKPDKFLDVRFETNEETEVNIKKFAIKPPHFNSNVPFSLKRSYFISQLHRANNICSTQEGLFKFRWWLFQNALLKGYSLKLSCELAFQLIRPSSNRNRQPDTFYMVQRIPSTGTENVASLLETLLKTKIPQEYKVLRARQYDKNIDKLLRAEMWRKGF
jgi:hypothetical protein